MEMSLHSIRSFVHYFAISCDLWNRPMCVDDRPRVASPVPPRCRPRRRPHSPRDASSSIILYFIAARFKKRPTKEKKRKAPSPSTYDDVCPFHENVIVPRYRLGRPRGAARGIVAFMVGVVQKVARSIEREEGRPSRPFPFPPYPA